MADDAAEPEEVARCVLECYRRVRPRRTASGAAPWTVLSGIVAALPGEPGPNPRSAKDDDAAAAAADSSGGAVPVPLAYRCCALATGTRCYPGPPPPGGTTLRDSHAEVLCRRAFRRFLAMEAAAALRGKATSLLQLGDPSEKLAGATPCLAVKPGVSFHMYLSETPCGDASIYRVKEACVRDGNTERYTGAKLLLGYAAAAPDGEAKADGAPAQRWRKERSQQVGQLRLKGSRRDLPASKRSACLSCSDKLARWAVLGLQGGRLGKHLRTPVYLRSICVSGDPEADVGDIRDALRRAIARRAGDAIAEICGQHPGATEGWRPPALHVVAASFEESRRSIIEDAARQGAAEAGPERPAKKQRTGEAAKKKRPKAKPDPLCLNWVAEPTGAVAGHIQRGTVEVTNGAVGRKQGAKRGCEAPATESRLSTRALARQVRAELELDGDDCGASNGSCDSDGDVLKSLFFRTTAFQGWKEAKRI